MELLTQCSYNNNLLENDKLCIIIERVLKVGSDVNFSESNVGGYKSFGMHEMTSWDLCDQIVFVVKVVRDNKF